ncbi:hypothetical protein J6590_103351 [Homalodisca vitripennis]|nr:hypothetical protein J6590_103351 [Homalodisca vitripennis]
MGKAKPRHKKNRRHNVTQPTGIPSVKEAELEESEFSVPESDKDISIDKIIEEPKNNPQSLLLQFKNEIGSAVPSPNGNCVNKMRIKAAIVQS